VRVVVVEVVREGRKGGRGGAGADRVLVVADPKAGR